MFIGQCFSAFRSHHANNAFFYPIPGIVAFEWFIVRQTLRRVDTSDLSDFVTIPSGVSIKGTIFTTDENIVEALIDRNRHNVDPTDRLQLDYLRGNQSIAKINEPSTYNPGTDRIEPRYQRKIFQSIIWGTAGSSGSTPYYQQDLGPKIHKIGFTVSIPEKRKVSEFVINWNVFINGDGLPYQIGS